jgi:hypothetical protein
VLEGRPRVVVTCSSVMTFARYFAFGIIFFAFYMSNLFIGVVFETFLRIKAQRGNNDGVSQVVRR